MKVLMATMGLGIGGAETHIVELARELAREGHEIIVASNGGVYVPELEAAGVRHVDVPMHRRSPALMAKSFFLMRRLIKAERPDVVHAHARIPAFICGLVRKTLRFPFVTTAHWVFDTGGMLRVLTNWGERTIAVSEDIREYLVDNYGIPRDRITVTINGIDTEKFSPEVSGESVREELRIPADAPVVSHVSRLDESRADAAAALIRVAPLLAGRVPGVRILIAGGGDRAEELFHRSEEANIKIGYRCIVMAGPRTDVNLVCAAGDMFVGVSRAALEAMAAGKPVVVAGNEGYLGLFDEDKLETGIEGNFCCRGCPRMEDQALLDDVTTALTLDSGERERLAALSRRVVMEHYSVGRMAQDALTVYRAVKAPRRVVLSGYYGYDNAGDEAILEAICRAVKEADPAAELTALSKDPRRTRERYGCRAVHRFSPLGIGRALRRAELLISGGGSLLQDNTSTRSLIYYLSIIHWAHRMGKRTMIYANGIGPVNGQRNRERVRAVVELADVVTLRDPDSLAELRAMGVTREDLVCAADPVFNLPEPDGARTAEILAGQDIEGPYITVSVRPYRNGRLDLDAFAGLCDDIADRCGARIVFVPMQPKVDGPLCWQIAGRMKSDCRVLSGEFMPEELMGVIGGGLMALSMRLHSLIFAARTATPAIGFAYDPKVASYLELLRQPSVDLGREIDRDAVLKAVDVIMASRREMVERLAETRDAIARDAMRNTRELKRLLNGENGE